MSKYGYLEVFQGGPLHFEITRVDCTFRGDMVFPWCTWHFVSFVMLPLSYDLKVYKYNAIIFYIIFQKEANSVTFHRSKPFQQEFHSAFIMS